MQELRQEADALCHARRFGVLAALSQAAAGYPFGSLAGYALDGRGRPLLLLSGLALHTRNAQSDPRVSLTVFDAAAEERPQTAPRLTLIGDLAPVPAEEDAAARAAYLERHPEARGYSQFGDFTLYRIAVRKSYFVAGFGRAGWI